MSISTINSESTIQFPSLSFIALPNPNQTTKMNLRGKEEKQNMSTKIQMIFITNQSSETRYPDLFFQ